MVQPAIESNRTSPTLDLGNACLAQFRCNLDEIRRGVAMTSESDVYRIIESADVAPAGNVLGMHMFKKGSLQISNVILVSRDVAKKLAAGHLKQRYAGKYANVSVRILGSPKAARSAPRDFASGKISYSKIRAKRLHRQERRNNAWNAFKFSMN